jgi:hypothetical protein
LGSDQGSHAPKVQNPVQQSSSVLHWPCGDSQIPQVPAWQRRVPQQSSSVSQSPSVQQIPPMHSSMQHCWSKSQLVPRGWHIVVVDVEVVLVEVEVVLVVVVVVCSWQVPLGQTRLPQHCVSLVQCFPMRLQPGGSAPASPMPSDPSVPPTTAAPISLSALPREMLPLASPLARSSKERSLASGEIGCLLPNGRDSSARRAT